MENLKTKEPQYDIVYQLAEKHGITELGLMVNETWNQDSKRVLFTLARYKFVAKIPAGKNQVLEIGCADAFGTRIVQQHMGTIAAIDFDPVFIEDAKARYNPHWPADYFVHDMLAGPPPCTYDASFCLDVLEHIDPNHEQQFLQNTKHSLTENGVFIAGMPSLESRTYASPQSKAGHVNCKSGQDFKHLMEQHFHNVFLFSMNDEIVHTGFAPMAHYVIVVCCGKKD